jgi:formate hydrogenlyase subunit 6/NADH:ubiquinone oxidoreductase subunit I
MRLGTMLSDVLRALFRRPVTELYPFERSTPVERLRALLQFNPEKCTGCGLCVKDCPAKAIDLITLDKASKRFVLKYELDRCTFCAQCVQSCRYKCLSLANDQWELAALNKHEFTKYYGRDTDVKSGMAQSARPGADIGDEH